MVKTPKRFNPQLEIELRGGNAVLYESTAPIVLIEGRRGTAKTTSWCKKVVDLCRQYPGSRHLVVRQTRESLTESSLVTLESVLGEKRPEVSRMARTQRHSYNIFGSEIVTGGLDKPSRLYSTEWDTVTVEEAIETTQDAVEQFKACMRHGAMPYHQIILATNPGHPGHWLNVTATKCPDYLRKITDRDSYSDLHEYNAAPQDGDIHRIISTHQDNPSYWDMDEWDWHPFGRQYVLENLSTMTGHRRARFFEGRWVAAEGGVFQEFDEVFHVIPEFRVPYRWPVFIGIDPGYDHPCAVIWFAIGDAGTIYIVDEIHRRQMSVPDVVQEIKARNAMRAYNVAGIFADPRDGWKHTMAQPTPLVQQFSDLGLGGIERWPMGRRESKVAQVENVRRYLTNGRLRVMGTRCPATISEFQSWSYKRNTKGEQLMGDDQYEDKNNDAMDVVCGMLSANLEMRRPRGASDSASNSEGNSIHWVQLGKK